MRLNPTAFNRHLNHMGQWFSIRKSFACPCVNPHSGAAKQNCPHCFGKGRSWSGAVDGRAGIVGRDAMKSFAQFGVWDDGDIMLSIPSDSPIYGIGQYDRVRALNRSEPFSMNMVRGQNDLMRTPVLGIDRVYWLNDQQQIVEASVPDVTDYGTFAWGANAPPMGKAYSITGRRQQEYFVYQEIPFDRPHHFGEVLPRRVVLRRFDLYGR